MTKWVPVRRYIMLSIKRLFLRPLMLSILGCHTEKQNNLKFWCHWFKEGWKINSSKPWTPAVFTEKEEKKITQCLTITTEWGFPLETFDIRCILKKADKKGQTEPNFKKNMPSSKQVKSFLKRLSDELMARLCKNIMKGRAAITPEIIEFYFEDLAISLKDVLPEAIINYDETSIQNDTGKKKVIVKRTCNNPERIMYFSKSNFLLMFVGTASGIPLLTTLCCIQGR